MYLAADEALLERAESGRIGECLRLCEIATPAVIMGVGAVWREEVHADACREAGVPVLRRCSGGGTVLIGRGCLNYSVLLDTEARPELRVPRESYGVLVPPLAEALSALGPKVEHAGLSDLAWQGCKVGGTAQKRKRRWLLHHGTLLYALDVASIDRFLAHPPDEPDYRAGRPHAEFLASLPLSRHQIEAAVLQAYGCPPAPTADVTDALAGRIEELVKTKYATEAWTYRR
jgi:lipoate-protein ligase A